MKWLLSLLLAGVLSAASHASQIITLNQANPTLSVEPTDIVQVVGVIQHSNQGQCNFTFANGSISQLVIPGWSSSGGSPTSFSNVVLTGVNQIQITHGTGSMLAVTLRVTKTADEIASDPVVLPPVADGIYAVTIETSTDMENWAPAAPGDYLGDSTHRFFRVKALRKPDTPAAAK